MKFTIYRNTRVFLIRASLTIDVVNNANTKTSRLYTSNAKFASDSNERRWFLFNEQSRKINRKIEILLIIWFRDVKWRRRRSSIRVLSLDVTNILFVLRSERDATLARAIESSRHRKLASSKFRVASKSEKTFAKW